MSTIGNILWFLFGGLIGGLAWVLAGYLCTLKQSDPADERACGGLCDGRVITDKQEHCEVH